MKQLKYFIIILTAVIVLNACGPAGGEHTGHEYMPDMAHSIAYESNVYNKYYLNTWDDESVMKRKSLSNPKLPVSGTIPRGYAGYAAATAADYEEVYTSLRGGTNTHSIAIPFNGHVPYHYSDTEEERTRASKDIVSNPFPISAGGLARGKQLYTSQCAICHGEKADGNGYLVSEENPNVKYPAAPANFMQDTFYLASNGRFYHAIMYGKNVMGAYADKLSFEERWQVIHYIRSLQAKTTSKQYAADANTFNPVFGMPEKQFKAIAGNVAPDQNAIRPGESQTPPEQVKTVQSDQQNDSGKQRNTNKNRPPGDSNQ